MVPCLVLMIKIKCTDCTRNHVLVSLFDRDNDNSLTCPWLHSCLEWCQVAVLPIVEDQLQAPLLDRDGNNALPAIKYQVLNILLDGDGNSFMYYPQQKIVP